MLCFLTKSSPGMFCGEDEDLVAGLVQIVPFV
jgi:hypothetical protein